MTTGVRSSAECLAEAARAEAEARMVSFEPHREQLLAIAAEWRTLALEVALRDASAEVKRSAEAAKL